MNIKKSENKITTNEHKYFVESNFVGVNRFFVLVYLNRNIDVKRFKTRRYYLLKGLLLITTSSSMEKTFMTKQLIQI